MGWCGELPGIGIGQFKSSIDQDVLAPSFESLPNCSRHSTTPTLMADKPGSSPMQRSSRTRRSIAASALPSIATHRGSSSSKGAESSRMASTALHDATDRTKIDTMNLMSPPEHRPMGHFSHSTIPALSRSLAPTFRASEPSMQTARGPNPPLSPPTSPLSMSDGGVVTNVNLSPVTDPILYPDPAVHSPSQRPLFALPESAEAQQIVDEHLVARPTGLFGAAAPPRRDEYVLMLYFKSEVMKKYKEDPRGWLRRERALLLADRRAGARQLPVKLSTLAVKPQLTRSPLSQATKPTRKKLRTVAARQTPARGGSAARPVLSAGTAASATADLPGKRPVAPNREDKDYESLPDYCPPLSSLPARANSLKVEWKGAPIDLSNDPLRHAVHPDELALAATLRLDVATYLTSKRRVFAGRLECLRNGKEFRKTDAQQACKIDVNKASKLHTAFERVGWLDQRWVSPYV